MPTKKEIRDSILSQRKMLSSELLQQLSEQVNTYFKTLPFAECKTLHVFLPIAKQNELNTWFLVNYVQKHQPQITCVVSKSDFKSCTMSHFVLENNQIEKSAWGIPEPTAAAIPFMGKIDWVLVPLLAFDKYGFRVGYGKGFYDRFLGNLSKKPFKIGICHSAQLIEISDIHEHDERLDICITPQGIIHF